MHDHTIDSELRKETGRKCLELTEKFCSKVANRKVIRLLEDSFSYRLRCFAENSVQGFGKSASEHLLEIERIIARAGKLSEPTSKT